MKNSGSARIAIEDIYPGMTASRTQTITDADVRGFATISGDHNPVHLDDAYAESTRFGKRIAHGLMSASFFSAIFGTQLPGSGCVYVSQNLVFKRPVFIGDTVVARVVVKAIDFARGRIFFDTTCEVEGNAVIVGEAEIYLPGES